MLSLSDFISFELAHVFSLLVVWLKECNTQTKDLNTILIAHSKFNLAEQCFSLTDMSGIVKQLWGCQCCSVGCWITLVYC